MADCSTSIVMVKDLDHKFVIVNQLFADHIGLSEDEIIGKTDIEIGIPSELVLGDGGDFPGFWKLDDEAIRTGMPNVSKEPSVEFINGQLHHMQTTRYPLRDRGGEITHILIMSNDITPQLTTLTLLETEREQLARRNAFQSSLSTLFRDMENSKEFVPLLQRIAEEVIVLLGADSTYISVVHESRDYIEVAATSGVNLTPIGFRHEFGEGIAGSAWREGEIQVVSDYYKYGNKLNGFDVIKQVCALPIKVDGEVVVVIGIVYQTLSEKFQERVVEFEEFAQQVTIVVENSKLIESARNELARTEALFKLSDALYTSNDIQTVLDFACSVVIDVFSAKHVQIYQTKDDGSVLASSTKTASRNDHSKTNSLNTAHSLPDCEIEAVFNSYMVNRCLLSQESVFVSRTSLSFSIPDEVELARARNDIGSAICVPLVHDEVVWGVLVAHRDKSKSDFTDADINLFGVIGNQASVAQDRQKLQSEIEFQAYHDSLTELPNRLQFEEQLIKAVQRAKQRQSRVAVLFLDLDGFKSVNDIFGHLVGDDLLKKLSTRLSYVFDSSDLLARMGGDEFAVLLENVESLDEVLEASKSSIAVLSAEYDLDEVKLSVGASIGISMYPDDSDTAGDLLKNADIAMYQAKSKGKNCAQYFNNSMAQQFQKRVEMEKELANAIDNNELRLVYQPKVGISNQSVLGVEALLRWDHRSRGNISPGDFIPIAEDSGLIIPLGAWVLQEACQQLAEWHKNGFSNLTMAVNVSVQQFNTGNFVEIVRDALESADLDACYLNLEVTESLMLVEVDRTVEKLLKLKELGLSVSIDDFGTGFSSLRYLQDLPLDYLKIDRSFIERLDDNNPQLSLVNTIIGMAETFGLETVAEGVETQEQLQKVVDLGCDCIQGFLFSKPVQPGELPGTIASIEGRLAGMQAAA